ncbi:MAG: DNA polymerase III subunit gamma/tau [Candidatus Omnitrophica bacterium]|nr:DNA polymerase III subunit gamma/tau [Candidatus Omnitrophota bacterium]
MEYQAFALKYRPKTFDDVVGQEHVVVSLKSAIEKKRVHHAYLFSGPRGVGKTSMARILAKSLNCEHGPTVTPCGKCPSCDEIARGTSLDILEIDGASNRGIDEIRSLRESVKLSPAHARYKVYIIDEVHMLTAEAFNALLKTLEEPPPHVKFIFATTAPQKVLPTILSRCQKFQFNLFPVEKIVKKLEQIASREELTIENSILYAIARAAGGSIRDAESLLDQLAPVVSEQESAQDMLSFLGIIDEDTLNTALEYVLHKDIPGILAFIGNMLQEGKELGLFLNACIGHLRDLLLAQVSPEGFRELVDISPQTKTYLEKAAGSLSTAKIMQLIDALIDAKDVSRKIGSVRIPLELAFIRFCGGAVPDQPDAAAQRQAPPRKYTAPARSVSAPAGETPDTPSETPPSSFAQKAEKPHPEKQRRDTQTREPNVSAQEAGGHDNPEQKTHTDEFDDLQFDAPVQDPEPEEAPAHTEEFGDELVADNILLAEVQKKWEQFLSRMQKVRAALAAHLSCGRPAASAGNVVKIGFPKKEYFHKEIVEAVKNSQFIEEALSRILNRKIGVHFVFLPGEETPPGPDPASLPASDELPGEENEFMNELLDTFGGNIQMDED